MVRSSRRSENIQRAAGAVALLCAAGAWTALQAADGLSVAGPGFPTSFVLDQFSAQAAALAGKAAGEGALEASRAAREAQLLAANARNELRDAGAERWDKLPTAQQNLLRELDRALADAQRASGQAGRIEDPVVLDLAARLPRLSFTSSTPLLLRIEGATVNAQAQPQDSYRVRLKTNLATLGATGYALTLAGQPMPAGWVQPTPPDQVLLNIPAAALAKLFSDRVLLHVPVELAAVLPNPSWKFWQSGTYQATLPFSLELFPRKPFGYLLKESLPNSAVDTTRVLLAKGKPQTVPGCGAPGCERDQIICNDAPAGAKALEPVFFTDSAAGDSGSHWLAAVNPTASGFCVPFKQRSPTRTREVNFDLRYNPALQEQKAAEKKLRALANDGGGTAPADADALELGRDYGAELTPLALGWSLVLKAFNGQNYSASTDAPPSSPLLRVTATRPAAGAAGSVAVRTQLPW